VRGPALHQRAQLSARPKFRRRSLRRHRVPAISSGLARLLGPYSNPINSPERRREFGLSRPRRRIQPADLLGGCPRPAGGFPPGDVLPRQRPRRRSGIFARFRGDRTCAFAARGGGIEPGADHKIDPCRKRPCACISPLAAGPSAVIQRARPTLLGKKDAANGPSPGLPGQHSRAPARDRLVVGCCHRRARRLYFAGMPIAKHPRRRR